MHHVVDGLSSVDASVSTFRCTAVGPNLSRETQFTAVRLRDQSGAVHGTILLVRPALPAGIIAETLFQRDPDYLQRMFAMSGARRRVGAVLFADLESSSALARRLSTASYFSLVRRIVRATAQCVVDTGGLVGRHVTAARAVRSALAEVARRTDLEPDEVSLRFGLHWAATRFMGAITTSARTEVTGLGDEANEAASTSNASTPTPIPHTPSGHAGSTSSPPTLRRSRVPLTNAPSAACSTLALPEAPCSSSATTSNPCVVRSTRGHRVAPSTSTHTYESTTSQL